MTLTNHDARPRELELTSYAEVVLARTPPTWPTRRSASCSWRPNGCPATTRCSAAAGRARPTRSRSGPSTSRPSTAAAGRARSSTRPTGPASSAAAGRRPTRRRSTRGATLSGTTGPVLDPVFSLRRRVRLEPGGSARVAFTTAVAESREEALALADQYHDVRRGGPRLRAGLGPQPGRAAPPQLAAEEAHLFQRLAAHLLFAGPALRAAPAEVAANRQGQPGLWRHGISGDRPIVLVRDRRRRTSLPLARQLLSRHIVPGASRASKFDLVLLNEQPTRLPRGAARSSSRARSAPRRRPHLVDQPGGVFVRKAEQLADEDRMLLQAAARVVLSATAARWPASSTGVERTPSPLPPPLARDATAAATGPTPAALPADLLFANGLGGFTPDGREYFILRRASPGRRPAQRRPAPARRRPAAGAVDQRGRQPRVRLPRHRERVGLHLGRQQPAEPPDALEQRPGRRPARRGRLPARRGDRRGLVPDAAARPAACAATLVRHGQGYTVFEQRYATAWTRS